MLVQAVAGACRYANLMVCGSIHCCPPCAATIRPKRAADIKAAATKWEAEGNGLVHVTLTFPHHAGMRLAVLWGMVADGLRFARSGRPWQRMKAQLGIEHSIRALEVTTGYNGWHPHVHLLLFVGPDDLAEACAQVKVYFDNRWGKWLARHGYGALDPLHGVKAVPSYGGGSEYLAKLQDSWHVGRELAGSDAKTGRSGHRTPFQVLADYYEHGNPADLALWREWEQAAPGHQALTWSKGLREWAGLGDDPDDQALAAEAPPEAVDVALISAPAWQVVEASEALYEGILSAGAKAGLPGINSVLAHAGLPLACPVEERGPPYE